jgi:hypothetical protein
MKPVVILEEELLEAFKTCQEKINAAEPGDFVPLTKEEWKAFTTAAIIQKGEINASQLH